MFARTSLTGSTFQSGTNTCEQGFVVERFSQKLHRSCSQCTQPHFFIAMGRDEDDRNPATIRVQLRLQFESGDSRHTDVGDHTSGLMLQAGVQKFLRRGKFSRRQANRFQQAEQCTAHQIVIIYNRDWFGLSLSKHAKKIARAPKAAQLYVGIRNRILT